VTISEKNKPGDKLRPDHVEWDVDACSGEQTLMICMNTDRNPGHAKRGIDYYEPTSCGPLVLNDGASLDGLITDPLVVSTCEGIDCTDADTDGWSVDCNDCNDGDPAINPDATEICTANGVDENCDELVDCADTETCNGQDCSVNGAANSAICVSPDCVEQDCTDSMDNDGDSDTDCDDTDCAADPACTG